MNSASLLTAITDEAEGRCSNSEMDALPLGGLAYFCIVVNFCALYMINLFNVGIGIIQQLETTARHC